MFGVIVNPISGTQNKQAIINLIKQSIPKEKRIIRLTKRPDHATKLVKKLIELKVKTIIAVGGDGTINEIAKALIGTNVALGIIPCGSGNGLARHLNIPLKPNDALTTLLNAKPKKIDYGKINKRIFFCTAGVGFDAKIGKEFANSDSRGLMTYLRSITKSFFSYKPKKYTLSIDGHVIKRRAFLITFANASQYGNNAYIAPNADITDGLLDVCILSKFPKRKALGLGIQLMSKKIEKSDYIEIIRGKNITLERKRKGPVHYDGEPDKMGTKLEVSVIQQGLYILAP